MQKHLVGLLLLQRRDLLLEVTYLLAQGLTLALPIGRPQLPMYPVRFAVNPLSTDASLPSVLADRAARPLVREKGTGNPLPRRYHVHGEQPGS
jgi:hypothetical protein